MNFISIKYNYSYFMTTLLSLFTTLQCNQCKFWFILNPLPRAQKLYSGNGRGTMRLVAAQVVVTEPAQPL